MKDSTASHPLLSRVVADSTDRAAWHHARIGKIGASNAASFAKVSSTESYARALLMPNRFEGNQYTRAGHTWEPALMAYARIEHNTRMFAHETIPEFVATPDGLEFTPSGEVVLGEGKIKHKPTKGPTPSEFRQVAWAQLVCGAAATKFVWHVLDKETGQPLVMEPQYLIIERDEKMIAHLLTIAHPVRAALIAAASFESETHV